MLRLNEIDRFTVACKALELVIQDVENAKIRAERPPARLEELVRSGVLHQHGERMQVRRKAFEGECLDYTVRREQWLMTERYGAQTISVRMAGIRLRFQCNSMQCTE